MASLTTAPPIQNRKLQWFLPRARPRGSRTESTAKVSRLPEHRSRLPLRPPHAKPWSHWAPETGKRPRTPVTLGGPSNPRRELSLSPCPSEAARGHQSLHFQMLPLAQNRERKPTFQITSWSSTGNHSIKISGSRSARGQRDNWAFQHHRLPAPCAGATRTHRNKKTDGQQTCPLAHVSHALRCTWTHTQQIPGHPKERRPTDTYMHETHNGIHLFAQGTQMRAHANIPKHVCTRAHTRGDGHTAGYNRKTCAPRA